MKTASTIWNRRKTFLAAAGITAAGLVAIAGAIIPARPACAIKSPDPGISTDNIKLVESEAGDLVADAVRAAENTDIAIVPGAAFKPGVTVPRPPTADQAVGLVDPATDTLSILNLRGDQIIAALERSVSFEPQPSSGFLQISGLRFKYDLRKEGGKRVVSATVNGQPLDASKSYKVATTKPLAIGQQGYFQIWDKSDIVSDTNKTLETAIRDYIKSKGASLSPSPDGRISEIEK